MRVTLLTVVALTTVALCSAAADPECKDRKSRKLPMHWAHPADCGRFYRCTNKGVKREIVCPDEMVYNAKTGKCTDNEPGLCNLEQIKPLAEADDACANAAPGEFVRQLGNCRNYYICANPGEGTAQFCNAGYIFTINSDGSHCVPDPDSICWQNKCLQQADNTKIADDADCRTYYTCANEEATKNECAAGEYYDPTSESCESDPDGEHCVQNVCTNAADGAKKPHPRDCHAFWECTQGQATPDLCAAGSYFDKVALECEVGDCDGDTTTDHTDCTTETTTPCGEIAQTTESTPCRGEEATTDSSGEFMEAAAESKNCPGGYVEGQFLAHPNDVELFYMCIDGKLILNSCMEGNFFDAQLGVCEPLASKEGTKENKKKPDSKKEIKENKELTETETEIKEQSEGKDKDKKAPASANKKLKGKKDTKESVDSETVKRVARSIPDGTGFFYSSSNPVKPMANDPFDTSKLFEMHDLRLLAKQNGFSLELEPEPELIPVPVKKPQPQLEQPKDAYMPVEIVEGMELNPDLVAPNCHGIYYEGQMVEYPTHCRKFLICYEGQMKLEDCGAGYFFDNSTTTCAVDLHHRCTEGAVLLAQAEAAAAAEAEAAANSSPCDGGGDGAGGCGNGIQKGDSIPGDVCYEYQICDDGKLVTKTCGPNEYFNNGSRVCEVDTDYVCREQNVCEGPTAKDLFPDPDNCANFYYCKKNKLELANCDAGEWFDPDYKSCADDVNLECLNPCEGTTEIIFKEYKYNICKYVLCNGGKAYVMECDNGVFNTTTMACETIGAPYCNASRCVGQIDGTTFPVYGDPSQFYICIGGVAVEKACDANDQFDEKLGICLPVPSTNCNQTLCEGTDTDGLAFPLLKPGKDTTSFCLCRQGEAFLSQCPHDTEFDVTHLACISTAACDPDLCDFMPDFTVSPNRDKNTSFCMCVAGYQVIVPCPNNLQFNGETCVKQPKPSAKCDQDYCTTHPDGSVFASLKDTTGFCYCEGITAVFFDCPDGYIFSAAKEVCLKANPDTVCDATRCENNEGLIFGANGMNNKYCYCKDDGTIELHTCPLNELFDDYLGICIVQGCDPNVCLTHNDYPSPFPADNEPTSFCICQGNKVVKQTCKDNYIFNTTLLICSPSPCAPTCTVEDSVTEAIGHPASFCLCKNGQNILRDCLGDYLFDPYHLDCVTPERLFCNITLCAGATKEPYSIPARNDPYSFCYCFSPDDVKLFSCPGDLMYDEDARECVAPTGPGPDPENPENPETPECDCPGGYAAGTFLEMPGDCRRYYVCKSGALRDSDCGAGMRFDPSQSLCVLDPEGTCVSPSTQTCVGAYTEGQMVKYPSNNRLYYVCAGGHLREQDCGEGNVFDNDMCKPVTEMGKRSMRSGPIEENATTHKDDSSCLEDDKRAVPTNCSQYELCRNGTWILRGCSRQRYYNSDVQRCQEPLDDTICPYARVIGLPDCHNDTFEDTTLPSKNDNCAQFYRCNAGKWKLEHCPQQHYYSMHLHACLPAGHLTPCQARNVTEFKMPAKVVPCRHMTVRPYAANCAMFLMCFEGEWWHQHCPLGMYFNRTLNYCLPNDAQQCAQIDDSPIAEQEDEFVTQGCDVEGALRASAFCDRYYVCAAQQWHEQQCPSVHYFDARAQSCKRDEHGICIALKRNSCIDGETRAYPLNCHAFEVCVQNQWHRHDCAPDTVFVSALGLCVDDDYGSCTCSGIRRACTEDETRPLPLEGKCTQFFYCQNDDWQLRTCLRGHSYFAASRSCVPHSAHDQCLPRVRLAAATSDPDENDRKSCADQADGTAVAHPSNCRHFFLCVGGEAQMEQECVYGSYFDIELGYCRPNDGSCRTPLSGVCVNASDGGRVPHAEDCRAYYHCSTVNGTQLAYCPEGEYFHNSTLKCRIDHGECRSQTPGPNSPPKCESSAHGTRSPHERYCNIYYACVKGLAIPVECPDEYRYSALQGQCIYDEAQECVNGQLSDNSTSEDRCGTLTDGTHLPDLADCTHYYVCVEKMATRKRCPSRTFFDAEQRLCVPDDGSCPYVDEEEPGTRPLPPDPSECEGKHGYMMPDPANCNNFYVCINEKLRRERCLEGHYFNLTLAQCRSRDSNSTKTLKSRQFLPRNGTFTKTQTKCFDKRTDFSELCAFIPEGGSSIAEQSDCRRYVSCEDDEPVVQRCRNGESYDSLLGFCRQTDGTCLLENGQRVGDCSGKHGQLVRDSDNCRGYFVCLNGQKIPGECAANEYFNKTQSKCEKDTTKQCSVGSTENPEQIQKLKCDGLSEAVLYPYTHDNCRSYFQCVKGIAKVHECAHGLYFNATLTRCVKEIQDCLMPVATVHRKPEVIYTKRKICENVVFGQRYANVDDHCRSYYVCEPDGTVAFTTCASDLLFNTETGVCEEASDVVCRIQLEKTTDIK